MYYLNNIQVKINGKLIDRQRLFNIVIDEVIKKCENWKDIK